MRNRRIYVSVGLMKIRRLYLFAPVDESTVCLNRIRNDTIILVDEYGRVYTCRYYSLLTIPFARISSSGKI